LLTQIRILNNLALIGIANYSIYLQILFQRLGFPGRLPFWNLCRSFFSGGAGLAAFWFGFLLGRSGAPQPHISSMDLAGDISYSLPGLVHFIISKW
jgi:hypothetical protein